MDARSTSTLAMASTSADADMLTRKSVGTRELVKLTIVGLHVVSLIVSKAGGMLRSKLLYDYLLP